MGCCKNVQSPEEETIISFFFKKLKENNFSFTINNYKENYDKISKFSGNNFKKLCKKEKVRMNFIKILRKEENSLIKNNKQKEEDIHKILYHIMILTILLDTKTEEFPKDDIIIENIKNDISKYNLINLKRELIELGYNLFNIEYIDINNNKVIIYHLIKLFKLCFQDFHDANNYISIKTYIDKIKVIIEQKCFSDEEEQYLFVKDNLLTLGEFFCNNNYIGFDESIPDKLIELSVMVLNHWYNYLIDNIEKIKEQINKNVRNTTDKIINYDEYNNTNGNKINDINIKFESLNNDNINDDIINKDIKSIFESLYYILKKLIQDIYSGKNTIVELESHLISKNDDKYIFHRIIIFLLFYECYIKEDEKLILCLMEYITDLYVSNESIIIKDDENNNTYYDIALNSYYIINKNKQLSKQYVSLLTQIFIKEIESNNINNNQLLISQLIQIYQKKEKTNKINKLFFYFILDISRHYNNIINLSTPNEIRKKSEFNEKLIKNIFSNLNIIIKAYFLNNANNGTFRSIKEKGVVLNTLNNYNLSTNNATYNIYNDDNLNNNFKISIINYEIITTNFFHFHNIKDELLENIEFYLYFHFFIINSTNIFILINDFSKREKIYHNLFKIITKLEIMLIKGSFHENKINNTNKDENNEYMNYTNDIVSSLQIILKINELNDPKNYIQDCYIFYKSLARNIKSLLDFQKSIVDKIFQIESSSLKIIYTIIFFILCQFINLINIPNSITKQNDEIIDSISKLNQKCGNLLSKIIISNFITYNNSSENQNYNYIKELFSKESFEQFSINNDIFKRILEIIYSKLFGKNTSLNIFFDNQVQNWNYNYSINDSINKSLSKLSDNITEINDNSIINYSKEKLNENFIEDISIQILDSKKKSNEKLNDTNNNAFNKTNSQIKIPSENENIVSNDKLVTNSFINDDNHYKNIKV